VAHVPAGVLTRLQGLFVRTAYRIYLWSFRGTQEVFAVSERIVEYPFAVSALRLLPARSRVLLVGCHSDLLSTILPAVDLDVIGIDVKEFPLEYPNFTFRNLDIRRTGLDSAVFDAVVAVSTIEHIGLFDSDPGGDKTAVREVMRLLKPGGQFVLTVPFASEFMEIPMRQRIYDTRHLRELLEGFDVVSLSPYSYTPERLWTPIPIDDLPAPSRYTTHCTALVLGQKPRTIPVAAANTEKTTTANQP
jgi:SAM-dependent methyltransferase